MSQATHARALPDLDPTPRFQFQFTASPTAETVRRIHALRADVFCRELGWVGHSGEVAEVDPFDRHATHLAVLAPGGDVAASLRLVDEDSPWMLDRVFRDLLPSGHVVRRREALEASRLAVARHFRGVRGPGGLRVADLLYRGAYRVCVERGARWVYLVTSVQVLRHMTASGLPCEPLGQPRRMPDGVLAVVALLDWEALDPAQLRRWFAPDAPALRPDALLRSVDPAAPPRPHRPAPVPAEARCVSR